jgi:hypothetical protein
LTARESRMRDDLTAALRERDMVRVKVLRTTLAAIGNAGAVEGSPRPRSCAPISPTEPGPAPGGAA